ncbi:unnamed protein product [Durusdinium trenchii]|uniref:EF-hand domain-containing protein n=1 Tax=Durusdinium trenchii TaxID=1381693 RepID=A0ABP0RJZ1_9DINO
MTQLFGDVAVAVQALDEALSSEEIRRLPTPTPSPIVPTPVRQVLKALEASMNAVDREEESVVSMLQSLRQNLEEPEASDLLLSLLSSSTFLLSGEPRVDALLGARAPLVLRRWVLQALAREIDGLWANFGQLLLQRLKTFLKGFRWLDKDESGAFGQTEFLRAYMELCMQAGTAESAEGFKTAYDLQRADAGFLFKLLAGSAKKKKNQKQREEEVGVSLYNLVMRVVGVHDQDLRTFRRQVYTHFPNVEACFAAAAEKDASSADLSEQQFLYLGSMLRQSDERLRRRPVVLLDEEVPLEPEKKLRAPNTETDRKFQRFFKGLDINCSGLLSVAEVKQAFAEVAPSVPFTVVRRRILLAYGSLNGLMNEVKRSNEDSDSEVEMGSGATGFAQAEKLSEFLELPSWRISAFLEAIAVKDCEKKKIKLPTDGP